MNEDTRAKSQEGHNIVNKVKNGHKQDSEELIRFPAGRMTE